MATSGNYRIKELPVSNVPAEVTVKGRISLTTNGAVSATRPSAGGTPATTGSGNLYTVTQLPTFNSASNANAYQITFTEGYFKNVSGFAEYHPAYSTTTLATNMYVCQSTTFDTASNSIVVYLVQVSAFGNAATPALATAVAVGSIFFEQVFLNTVSPSTT